MDWFSWLSRTTLEPSLIYDYGLTFARNELQLEDACYFNHEFLQSMGISIAKHRLEILKLVKKEGGGGGGRPKKLSGVIKKCLRKCMNKFVSRDDDHVVKGVPSLTHVSMAPPEINWYEGKLRGSTVVRKQQEGSEDGKEEKPLPVPPVYRSRTIALSGPLDGSRIMQDKMLHNKALKLSGPLDGRMHERMIINSNRSPLIPRPLDARFVATTKSPRVSGPLDPRLMAAEIKSPRLPRPSDFTRADIESPVSYSPYNKPKADFDYDDDHTLWPSLFQDLKPT
ncbi:hypothetical protein PHAVU_003G172900 [Phaseolus vulgaris]|uniref:SAM domain-containing protein n=1 Tax=Phaseolus vulgaris TaxID=3885 RepID=V7CDX6_PHAVU|nr:hypothetical protein PHAVU_003G172900g [Phaseolus vulgaris]ESW27091.1 hypothetical protein PHAVU_003G172900g [Phaseolus vulgaris]